MEPASPTLPDKNQLTAKVSRVPKVRQLIALRTDRECVSPMNKITLVLSNQLSRFNHITAAGCHTPLVRMIQMIGPSLFFWRVGAWSGFCPISESKWIWRAGSRPRLCGADGV